MRQDLPDEKPALRWNKMYGSWVLTGVPVYVLYGDPHKSELKHKNAIVSLQNHHLMCQDEAAMQGFRLIDAGNAHVRAGTRCRATELDMCTPHSIPLGSVKGFEMQGQKI